MNFHESFIKLIRESSVEGDGLVDILQVSPETVRRWMAGKLLPGRKKLITLLDHIQSSEEIRNQLIKLHSVELKKSPQWGERKNSFTEKLSEVFGVYTSSEISRKTGISHQSISNWKAGKLVPSVDNLLKISESLGLNQKSTERLIHARGDEKVKKPFGRKRKSQNLEDRVISDLLKKIPKNHVIKSRVPGLSFLYRSVPVFISLQTHNRELLFTRCCLTMMRTNSDLLYLLVDQPLPNPFAELYQNYRIMVFTPEEFLEQLNKL